jgi:uncharacterized RDD family membrane protein YckC
MAVMRRFYRIKLVVVMPGQTNGKRRTQTKAVDADVAFTSSAIK